VERRLAGSDEQSVTSGGGGGGVAAAACRVSSAAAHDDLSESCGAFIRLRLSQLNRLGATLTPNVMSHFDVHI